MNLWEQMMSFAITAIAIFFLGRSCGSNPATDSYHTYKIKEERTESI